MTDFSGYTLKDALNEIELESKYIIRIIRIIGVNKRYNMLTNPYVIKNNRINNYLDLYITYY